LIIGNGDAQGLHDAYRRARASGAAGVLLGRAAQGNPWLFAGSRRIKNGAASCAESAAMTPALPERFRVILEHCAHFEKHAGLRNFVAMRKHLTWYCRNFRGASELRSRMTRMSSPREVAECLESFLRLAEGDTLPRAAAIQPAIAHAPLFEPWGTR
jgi:tRNA-dihydrouridine synthase B